LIRVEKVVMIKNLLLFLLLLIASCKSDGRKFDSETWNGIDGNNFSTQREPLVKDLIQNHLHQGMSYTSLTKLLGEPEIIEENNRIGYILYFRLGVGIDPVEGRNLIIQLTGDSTVLNYKVVEWKK
jgi:hypothetical protein